jgi:hypothetical protein
MVQARLLRARLSAEDAVAFLVGLERIHVDDVLRPLRRLADLGLTRGGLALPRPRTAAGLHPRGKEPRQAGAGEVRRDEAGLWSESEHVEAVVPRAERVSLPVRAMDDAVAGTYLVDIAVLPREP